MSHCASRPDGQEHRLTCNAILRAVQKCGSRIWRREGSDLRFVFRTVPEVRQLGIRISRNEGLARSIRFVHGSPNGSDVGTVDMDADGWLAGKGVRNTVEIANI